jgi:glycogen phosphorylase
MFVPLGIASTTIEATGVNTLDTNLGAEHERDPIAELALDLRWTWNHSTDELWRELEPELWEVTRNPWIVLQTVSRDRLQRLRSEKRFRERVDSLLVRQREIEAAAAWFQKTHPDSGLDGVAYFSMEYMLSEALPIYAGGLGNVAGDHLKTASDLGIPVIGIGLLYQQDYFRQEIERTGAQVARYPYNDPGQLPIQPLRNQQGDWLRLSVSLPGHVLWIRTWEARVGRRKLYLLDTNDPSNLPAHRTITSELYGGGPELRLRQEIVLGIGGCRLLRALGIEPKVYHLNEGHSAFAVLERARCFMEDHQAPFPVALTVTRAGNLFTTHTAVDAGFDRFDPELMESYLKEYAQQELKMPFQYLLSLGRQNPNNNSEPFNMAYLAVHGSGAVNAVSRLHGQVSRHLFAWLFPRWPKVEVPVRHVTNGVHVPTWDSAEADSLWAQACGEERWRGSLEYVEEQIRCVDDSTLWQLRSAARTSLVAFVRRRLAQERAYRGASCQEIEDASKVFEEHRLTLGFARRFATYKRMNMLLHDPQRLIRILTNPARPAQLVLGGKAHPKDWQGQAMIKQWIDFIRRPEVEGYAVFLSDYDMLMTQELVAGVDLWLNTPRRPWEACGTSGMKVLANGGLNLSELDGWWAEAYSPDIGWAIGDHQDRGDDPAWDATEADALYTLLEREIVPSFYDRDWRLIPQGWTQRMRESMARLTPAFSSNRMARQYTEEYYIPLASAYCARTADGGRTGAELLAWQQDITSRWSDIRFGSVTLDQRDGNYFFSVRVHLGKIKPDDVEIELYADPLDSRSLFRAPMALHHAVANSSGDYEYSGAAPGDRPANHYTPRAIPRRPGISIPLETALIAWEK